MELEQGGHHHEGYTREDIADTIQRHVDSAAVIALNGTVHCADTQVDGRYQNGKNQGETGAQTDRGE